MNFLLHILFGCQHDRESWPLKPRNRAGQVMRNLPSRVSCLRCGRERDYTLLDVDAREPVTAGETKEATE